MNLLRSIFLDRRFFLALAAVVFLFLLGYFLPAALAFAKAGFVSVILLLAVDLLLLYRGRGTVTARREMAERLSNGDANQVRLLLQSSYGFNTSIKVIDELPPQFQIRDHVLNTKLPSGGGMEIDYTLRPTSRGEYRFGALNLYVASPISLVRRRVRHEQDRMVPVYPSYIQMRKYALLAISNRLVEAGVKKIRKIGQTMEFDQIREYVIGDDYRTINWNATARRAGFMVNQYQDEKSQQVYSVIDKGRAMRMPFEGMTLLDYAINSSLVLSNIAIQRQDKAGLITFADKMGTHLQADRRRAQMRKIVEILYSQSTEFLETDYALLYANIRQRIAGRSLLLLYTNFETVSSMQRQLPYLRNIARNHLLVVIFFENTELRVLLDQPAASTEAIYLKAVAEKFLLEKKQIVKELTLHGIHSILTTPRNLTVNTLNKYLELKARRLI